MVIFRITKEMSEKEYLEYSKRIVQQYEWGKNNDNCLVVPEYVEVYVVNNKQVCVEDSGADLSWLWGRKMRLIDADKTNVYTYELDKQVFVDAITRFISLQPTVDAIPVEWIKDYIDFGVSDKLAQHVMRFVSKMIEDWEKEKSVKTSEGNYDSDKEYEEQMRCLDETNRCR